MYCTWGMILGAGAGKRTGLSTPKQFILWKGRPLYWWSALVMSRCVQGMVFVFNEDYCEQEEQRILSLADQDNFGIPWKIAAGGSRRQDSCGNGLIALPPDCRTVLVHDAARPFVTSKLVLEVKKAVSASVPCVVPAVPVSDTIRLVDDYDSSLVKATLPRSKLAACQTPQGFWVDSLRKIITANDVTDEAAMMEQAGYPVKLVEGEVGNIKITTPEDLKLLDSEARTQTRTGFGYDAHRYGGSRPFVLGGIHINTPLTLEAHSDGDVLLHALMDALLGVACLGDLGHYFPDTDPLYDGINSALLLDQVCSMVERKKCRITYADLTVVAQKPRLASYALQIERNIASLLNLQADQVNFKATTEERLGFTGSCEGIKAYALVTGEKLLF